MVFDGRRIWSFWLQRDGDEPGGGVPGGLAVRAAPVPERHARGSSSSSTSPARWCTTRRSASARATSRIAVVNERGLPLGIDKSLRLAQTFDTRSAEHVAPLLDSIEEVLAALRRPASTRSRPTARCSAPCAAAG